MNWQDLLNQGWSIVTDEIANLSRIDIIVAAACVLVAAYTMLHLWLLARRDSRHDAIMRRLGPLKGIDERPRSREAALDTTATTGRHWYDRLGTVIAGSMAVGPADRVRLTRMLADAGLRGSSYRLASLVVVKLCTFAVAAFAGWVAVSAYGLFANSQIILFAFLLGAALSGWRLPDIVLGHLARARRKRIEQALPDALDLLVISAEAGLSLEQGIEFVATEMATAMPDIGEEFAITSAELRVLGDRRQALINFAERINLQSVRSIVATLAQTMRYGTPLAQSLRLLAAEMRTARLLRIEARAARMPVLLTLPLMCFVLPSLVLVIAGPAILQAIDGFRIMLRNSGATP